PHLGILGAAIGWAVSILVANLVPLGQLMISTGLHPVGRASVIAVAICTVAVVPVAAVARIVGGDHLVPALIATSVAVLLWAALSWRFRGPLQLDAFVASRRRGRRGPGNGNGPPPAGPAGPGGPAEPAGPAGPAVPAAPGRPARSGRAGRGRHRA